MFKVGDKVRRISPSHCPEQYGYVGDIFTVSSVSNRCIGLKEKNRGLADASCFELVEIPEVKEINPMFETTIVKTLKTGWHGPFFFGEVNGKVHIDMRYDSYTVEEIDTLISQLTEVRDYLKEKNDE